MICGSGRDMAEVPTLFIDKDKAQIKQLVHLLPWREHHFVGVGYFQ